MTSGEQRRKSIFEKYSENLTFLNQSRIISIELKFDQTFICPICLNQFSEKSLDQSVENPLTLEDVPPKSLGGKANILTCKKCNNTCGHVLDKHLTERMIELDIHGFLPDVEFPAKFEIDGKIVQGLIKIDSNGKMTAFHMNKNNNPVKLKDYIHAVKNAAFELHIPPKNVNPNNLQLALLKIGYLLVFEKYGYSIILDKSYDRIRHQLLNPFEVTYPLDFWFKPNWSKELYGVPFIFEKGFEAICPIFPLKTKSSERVFVTLIPLSTKPIEEVICELKRRLSKPVRLRVAFDPMNGGVDYLTHIEAIKKMKEWISNLSQIR